MQLNSENFPVQSGKLRHFCIQNRIQKILAAETFVAMQ
ncbi:hypothetical protein PNO31109_03489 [Pandoraea nosoerga]|uniref:Uncharacterized protein n=1 Tax=Pandoraea nosoerga TaxID=2508296 RepID=A0A5E4WYL3_9BURK|nr:hypothetical protein PNO31109_03489 [Pandoraea nosoerga]